MAEARSPRADARQLESYFKLLAYANRIELLSLLREPHTLEELRLSPGSAKAGNRPERPISKQAVHYHLDQLVRAGLVRVEPSDRPGHRRQYQYVADPATLFRILEEFRKVTTLAGRRNLPPAETVAGNPGGREKWEPGPKLVLVHGVQEGRSYPLRQDDLPTGRGWVVGRRQGLPVRLEYDPFISLENSEVIRDRTGFRLLDLRSARNGTFLNWERLPLGGEAPLRPGDVIGVGRSLLLLRDS